MKRANLGTQIRQILIVTVLIGSVSYGFNIVTARILAPDDAARILTCWTVINLCLLIIQFPIELYGPRLLRLMLAEETESFFDALVFWYIGVTSLMTFGLFYCYYTVRYSVRLEELVIFGILIAASSWFQVFRTINISHENLTRLVKSASLLCLTSFLVFLTIYFFTFDASVAPLLATTFGFIAGGLPNVRHIDITKKKLMSLYRERNSFREVLSMREMGALSLSNLVSLLLVPGGAIFTGFVGLGTEATVVYLASVSLTLIPTTILNSTTMPVYLRAVNAAGDKDVARLKVIFLKTMLVYLSISVLIVLVFWGAGEKMLLIFLGNKYQSPQGVLLVSAIASCVAFVASIPRLFLMALGKTRQTYWLLFLTVGVYLGSVVLMRNGYAALFVSSILGSVFIGAMTFKLLNKNIRSLSSAIS